MKQVFEIRCNSIYSASELGNKLRPEIEMILVHTDGKQYVAKGNTVTTTPILKETRFFVSHKELDQIITDLQKWKLQMVQIEQNCTVINNVIDMLNKKPNSEQNVQVSDTTDDDSSNEVGNQK